MTTKTVKEENIVTTQTVEPDMAKAIVSKAQPAKEVISVKQPLKWHFMSILLELIRGQVKCLGADFDKLFNPLEEFVNAHLDIPDGLEIANEYVVCECVKV